MAEAMKGKYGLYDVQDNLWCGNDEGPLRYDDRDVALVAKTVLCIQMGWTGHRIDVREVPADVFRKRDSLDTKMGVIEAIKIAEGESPRSARRTEIIDE